MNHQMILFDLDGTLFTSDSTISPITANSIKSCKQKGYRIGIITARTKSEKNVRLLNGIPYDFIAFYNGAEMYVENQLIESNALPYRQASLILLRLNEDFPDLVIDVHNETWSYSSIRGEICHIGSGRRKTCNLGELPVCDVQRIRMKSGFLASIPLKNYMTADSAFYHTAFGDAIIVHKNANKGYAAKRASEFFVIPLTSMMAFGDDINDIDMLENVGIGVAMGNAVPGLKKIADYVTEANDCNGIATWINEHLV